MRKTDEILRLCMLAIKQEDKQSEEIEKKLEGQIENLATGDEEDSLDPNFIKVQREGEDIVKLTLGEQSRQLLLDAIRSHREFKNELNYHLHNILLVSIWTNFETYLQGALLEFYQKHPEQMKSDKQITYDEIVDHRYDIIDYLIDREISDVGRRSFADMRRYIKRHVHYEWPASRTEALDDIYFLRNIIAHNSGVIRSSQKSLVPCEIPVVGHELRIPIEFLQRGASSVKCAVDEIHDHFKGKWFGESHKEIGPSPEV